MKISHLTSAEEDIMRSVWKLHSAYLRDIMSELPEPKPHQNTVSTYLKILVEKKFIRTEKEGRIFKYQVVVPYRDYQNFKIKSLAEDYFNEKPVQIIERLLDLHLLKSEDLHDFFTVETKVKPSYKKKKKKNSALKDFVEELTKKKKKKKD